MTTVKNHEPSCIEPLDDNHPLYGGIIDDIRQKLDEIVKDLAPTRAAFNGAFVIDMFDDRLERVAWFDIASYGDFNAQTRQTISENVNVVAAFYACDVYGWTNSAEQILYAVPAQLQRKLDYIFCDDGNQLLLTLLTDVGDDDRATNYQIMRDLAAFIEERLVY